MSFKYFLLIFSLIFPHQDLFCLSVNKKTVGIGIVIGIVCCWLISKKLWPEVSSEEASEKHDNVTQKEIIHNTANIPHTLELFHNTKNPIDSTIRILYPFTDDGASVVVISSTTKNNSCSVEYNKLTSDENNNSTLLFSFYDKGKIEILIPQNLDCITPSNYVLKNFKINGCVFGAHKTEIDQNNVLKTNNEIVIKFSLH